MKEKLRKLWQAVSFRSLWDEDSEEDWEDFDTREDYVSGEENRKAAVPKVSRAAVWVLVIALAAAALIVYEVSSRHHMYTSYRVTASYPGEDVSGTSYAKLGNDFLKYGADGVTLADASNRTIWSSAYTMQTTAFDQCGKSVLIYEQQGSQVFVADSSGMVGHFETDIPILKGSVASNGVSALLMKDDQDVLIRLYSPDGTALAEVQPTLGQSGQPIALDLSAGATKLMVSMVKVGAGSVDSTIVFYDFSSASESAQKHITGTVDYAGELFGDVFFAADSTPVAVANDRIAVFSGTENPKEKNGIEVSGEITSVLHSEDYIGIVRMSDDPDNRYRLTVFNYRGKQTMDTLFNESYQYADFDSGEILLWSEGHMMAYTPKGVRRFDSDFDSRISLFVKIPGFRRYCILSNSGITRIEAE